MLHTSHTCERVHDDDDDDDGCDEDDDNDDDRKCYCYIPFTFTLCSQPEQICVRLLNYALEMLSPFALPKLCL